MKKLNTITETSKELCLSPYTIRAWIRERKIGYIRLGRVIRIQSEEIERIINEGNVPATRPNHDRR